jgi:hypothetical protein
MTSAFLAKPRELAHCSAEAEQDSPANGSQPFSSGDKSNVIGGWLPSLTFAFYTSLLQNILDMHSS